MLWSDNIEWVTELSCCNCLCLWLVFSSSETNHIYSLKCQWNGLKQTHVTLCLQGVWRQAEQWQLSVCSPITPKCQCPRSQVGSWCFSTGPCIPPPGKASSFGGLVWCILGVFGFFTRQSFVLPVVSNEERLPSEFSSSEYLVLFWEQSTSENLIRASHGR